ncbi:hypothetical protein Tco_0070656 [Tanacetum coccineum]
MNNIRSMRMTDIVNALQQGASDNTREGFQLIFKEFLSRPVVVSQLCCLDTKLREIDSSIMKARVYWLLSSVSAASSRKFMIVCHEKVVRIPLEGDEILSGFIGETTCPNDHPMKVEFRVDLVPGATPVAKSPYHLAPLEMQELSEQLQELYDEVKNWEVPTTPSEI